MALRGPRDAICLSTLRQRKNDLTSGLSRWSREGGAGTSIFEDVGCTGAAINERAMIDATHREERISIVRGPLKKGVFDRAYRAAREAA